MIRQDRSSLPPNNITPLFLAGLGNSGSSHWQRHWQRQWPASIWVEHADWEAPSLEAWVTGLEAVVSRQTGPCVVVAHSLGCLLFLEWAARYSTDKIRGAFLVAVPDPSHRGFPKEASGFPSGLDMQPCLPTLVVGSGNDPFADIHYGEECARRWLGGYVDVGRQGHINADSGLGAWPEGQQLLKNFITAIQGWPATILAEQAGALSAVENG